MKLEQTPFCTANGLLNFSKVMTDLHQKLLTAHNLNIKDKSKEDKLESWGKSECGYDFCYGRHFIVGDQYDFWIGLDIIPDNVTVAVVFDKENNKTINKKDFIDMLAALKSIAGSYFHTQKKNTVHLNDDYFERFCESLSSQILLNFAAEVFKGLKFIP